ncbi:unnamed protein product [Urochloa humidicola]
MSVHTPNIQKPNVTLTSRTHTCLSTHEPHSTPPPHAGTQTPLASPLHGLGRAERLRRRPRRSVTGAHPTRTPSAQDDPKNKQIKPPKKTRAQRKAAGPFSSLPTSHYSPLDPPTRRAPPLLVSPRRLAGDPPAGTGEAGRLLLFVPVVALRRWRSAAGSG